MAFATPAELAAYTKGRISATDARVPDLLEGATRAIQRYAGWHIWPEQTETFVLDVNGSDYVQLPTLRLTGVTSVTPRGSTVLTDDTDFEWTSLGIIRRLGGYSFDDKFRGLTVVATHGFDSVPDLKQVVLQAVSMALSSPTGATREQAGQVAMSWATTAPGVSGGLTLLDRDLAVVNTYKLPRGL